MKIERRNQNAPVALARSIRMRIVDENGVEDGATAIDNSEIINHKSDMIYDLLGRRIMDTTNLKGMYVVNGRKVMF